MAATPNATLNATVKRARGSQQIFVLEALIRLQRAPGTLATVVGQATGQAAKGRRVKRSGLAAGAQAQQSAGHREAVFAPDGVARRRMRGNQPERATGLRARVAQLQARLTPDFWGQRLHQLGPLHSAFVTP